MRSSVSLVENFHICDILFSMLYTLICIFIVLCCFLMLKLKLLTTSYLKNYGKSKNLNIFYFALVTDDIIKFFDDVIIFETCDQVIFIACSLKIKHIKFHGFSMKRTGFIVIFLPSDQKAPLRLWKVQKSPPGIRLNREPEKPIYV